MSRFSFLIAVTALLALTLSACAANGPGPGDSLLVVDRSAAADTPQTRSTPKVAVEIDRSCKIDADCEVKNVGNCCGYYPQCVNVNSPTDPEQVKADCAREGRSSICGFPSIDHCQCVEGQCAAKTGPTSGLEDIVQ